MAAVLLYSPLIGEVFESGDKLYAYETGTSTPVTLYQDDDLSTAHASPVVADSTGRFAAIYADATGGDLKITVDDSDDVERFTVDPVIVTDLTSVNSSISTLNTQYTSLNGRLTTAESEIDTLQTESTDYESRITTLEGVSGTVNESDFTGSNQSKSTNGFQYLPGGILMQWGKKTSLATSPSTGTDITFPEEFPTACFMVMANEGTPNFPGNASNWGGCPCEIKSTTQFTLYPATGITRDYFWFAIGH